MAVVSSFPLLCLPQENLKDVLLRMGIIEQFCFSMISNKTKNFIRMFKVLKSATVRILIFDSIRYDIFDYHNYATEYSLKNGQVRATRLFQHQSGITFSTPQFDVWSLFKHFLYIIDPSKIDLSYQHVDDQFDEDQFEMAKECLKGIEISNLVTQGISDMEHVIKLINTFLPTEQLEIWKRSIDPRSTPSQLRTLQPILCQKFSLLKLFDFDVTLNNLLIINCSKIVYLSNQLSNKDARLFLKHWITGMKPELEEFWILRSTAHFNFDTIFDGMTEEFTVCEFDAMFKIIKKIS